MGSALRTLFLAVASLVAIGIWLSGYNQVHWFAYVPLVVLVFAGVTGICPGLTCCAGLA